MDDLDFYCIHCGWGAKIQYYDSKIGKRWICKCCGLFGLCGNPDEPKLLPKDSQGEYEPDFDFIKRIWGF